MTPRSPSAQAAQASDSQAASLSWGVQHADPSLLWTKPSDEDVSYPSSIHSRIFHVSQPDLQCFLREYLWDIRINGPQFPSIVL